MKSSNLGIVLAISSPFMALACAGLEAFVPVALSSVSCAVICFLVHALSTQMVVGTLTAELVQDLVCADEERRDLVLGCLSKKEQDWFLAELPRARAELRRQDRQRRPGKCAGVQWRWRLRLLNKVA